MTDASRAEALLLMFDLDGTLTDSRPGITRCIEHALREVGATPPSPDALRRLVGPPLPRSFATLLDHDAERVERAVAAYRDRFERVGMFENSLYDGVAEMLADLGARHELRVVTAKPRVYAERILEHFGLAGRFLGVHGPELDARVYTKASLIRDACATRSAGTRGALMIGDRADDVLGARSNGVGAVAVTWGYGDRTELTDAEPDGLVDSTGDLVDFVRRHAGA